MERSVAGILVYQGKAFVAKRGASGSFCGRWEFPGGKVEAGESDEAAVAREFREEFGIEVRALRSLGESVFPHKGEPRILAAWLIDMTPFMKPQLLEHDEVAWADADELSSLDLVDSDRKILPLVLPLLNQENS
jgi:8-oxo-dGTP diphosphatase